MPARLHTPLCATLGIDLPIIQAPIGSVTTAALAAAVSNAGGLGMLAVTWRDLDAVRQIVRDTRRLTDRPFGVNLVLDWPPEERLRLCLDEGVPVVSFFWGDPTPYVPVVHDAGARAVHTVASAAEAERAAAAGVDVIVAQGWEAGGHVWGEVTTMALAPRVVDAVAPLPVVAAGLLAEEAATHPVYQEQVVRADETDTVYSQLFDIGWPGAPHRALRNSTVRAWEAGGRPVSGARPGEGEVVATAADGRPVHRYSDVAGQAGMVGEVEALALYAGQGAGLVTRRQPAGEIVREIADEAVRALQVAARLA